MTDAVKKPDHYNAPGVSECRDLQVALELNYFVGCAFKYLYRCNFKGNYVEDLKKAREYLDFEIKKHEKVREKKPLYRKCSLCKNKCLESETTRLVTGSMCNKCWVSS